MKNIFSPKRVNYLYFGFLFFCLALVHSAHVLLLEKIPQISQLAFLVDVILQSFLEALFLLVIAVVVRHYLPRFLFFAYIALTFLLLVAQLIDFFLIRLMDMTIWFAMSLMLDESLSNFLEILKSSNVPLSVWAVAGTIAAVLPFIGVLLFVLCEKLEKKREFFTSITKLVQLTCAVVAVLAVWDLSTVLPLTASTYENLRKTLPLKETVFAPNYEKIPVRPFLPKENIGSGELGSTIPLTAVHKPDIFIFVIESLRDDFITQEISPHLASFKKENVSFDLALSSANATHLSWFSLFYSKFPFHWTKSTFEHRKTGSPALKALKELGYTLNVYSSARLCFYEMDEKLFGEKRSLVDRFFVFGHGAEILPYQSDERTMEKLMEEMRARKEIGGQVHIIFLESTHFDYSWPQETASPFLPIVEKIDYLKFSYSEQDLELIKNRYRNSIHYVDGLFGKFLQVLKQTKNDDKAVVVVTADHGEEFFEDGHLFHASTLNIAQTHVPLYYKFGDGSQLPAASPTRLTSHIDIFPTLFHYLLGTDRPLSHLQGESIFKAHRWPYAVSARYNGERDPKEFLVHSGKKVLTLRMEEDPEFSKSQLSVLSVKDRYGENNQSNFSVMLEEFDSALETVFSK
ncbi:MAG: sulfatase-like hydrolase/transferase [Chlamydiales bacterium]|nr:sulfatase-like hydrolase/transferase [Chlamydiales bacterium]